MELRDYQAEAVRACYDHLRTRDDNPCIVIPTGGGKTPVLAQICLDATTEWAGRVIVLAHVKELLEQAVKTLHGYDVRLISKVGVYSAGLGKKEKNFPITVAGIQSVYKQATKLGPLNLIIVDEADRIPVEGEGMYRQFLAEAKLVNPNVRVVGLTATPYRMQDGMICAPENILNHVCHETGVRELIARGFLCNLKSRAGSTDVDTSGLHIRAGEFIQSEIETLMDTDALVEAAAADIVKAAATRKAVLVFAAGVKHGGLVAGRLRALTGQDVGEVYGDTPSTERAGLIQRFREGSLKFLVNMNVLTIGFDAPNVDMICLLRPTASPGLYYQMVGRGFRICEGKSDCLVLDYGNNVLRHGPVDLLRPEKRVQGEGDPPAKKCPGYKCSCGLITAGPCSCGLEAPKGADRCGALIHAAYRVCPECGYEFPEPQKKHRASAGSESVLSGDVVVEDVEVAEVFYSVHTKRGADAGAPKTMRVSYLPAGIRADLISEWVCIEHPAGTYPQRKAAMWWRARSNVVCPKTAVEAVALAHEGALAKPSAIKVEYVPGERFPRIVSAEVGELPAFRPWQDGAVEAADDEAERKARFEKLRAEMGVGDSEPPF